MILEIVPAGGVGSNAPLRISASQLVIRSTDGTPIGVAAEYGTDRSVVIASAAFNNAEFSRVLKLLGINTTVLVETVRSRDVPAGAVLLGSPSG